MFLTRIQSQQTDFWVHTHFALTLNGPACAHFCIIFCGDIFIFSNGDFASGTFRNVLKLNQQIK